MRIPVSDHDWKSCSGKEGNFKTERKNDSIWVEYARIKSNGREDKIPLCFAGKVYEDHVKGHFHFDRIVELLIVFCILGSLATLVSAIVQKNELSAYGFGFVLLIALGLLIRLIVKYRQDKPKIIAFLQNPKIKK